MLNTTIRKIFTVNDSVASLAERQPVGDHEPLIGIFSPFFYVASVQIPVSAAMLASELVAAEHGLTPLGYFALLNLAVGFTLAALPSEVLRSASGDPGTFERTILLPIHYRGERHATAETVTRRNLSGSFRPTRGRAELGSVSPILFNLIRGGTDSANFGNASISHSAIIAHNRQISENYCAFILERMQTAFPDLEIKRIEAANAANG